MSLQEEKINREIKKFVDFKRLIESCDAVSIIKEKEEKIYYLFQKDDFSDFDKDILDCMVSGLSEKIKNLLEEREKIREGQQNDGHSESN